MVTVGRPSLAAWSRALHMVRGLGWGVADQAVSSVTNFAMVLYVAHTVGAAQFGAFSLAYVTYSFALNASRGVSSEPLIVRFSGVDLPTWRLAAANCTGTAAVVGLVTGVGVVGVAIMLSSAARFAFLALGLTLPALLLQDSWRFAFFAARRGGQAFLNDLIWALALLPALKLLRAAGAGNVFWFVFAWGAAAGVAAAAGLLQARVAPKLSGSWAWLSHHRDLGFRYVAENTSNSLAWQLRTYGLGAIGLAAVGYVQAAGTLLGPVMVVFMGISIIGIPEAARTLRGSPQRLLIFCLFGKRRTCPHRGRLGSRASGCPAEGSRDLAARPDLATRVPAGTAVHVLDYRALRLVRSPGGPPRSWSRPAVCACDGSRVGRRSGRWPGRSFPRRSPRVSVRVRGGGIARRISLVVGVAAAMRESAMVATDDRNAERPQEPTMEPRPAAQRQDAIRPFSPSQASSVPPVPPVSYGPPSRLTRVPVPPNRFAPHGLPMTPMPWSTQVTWAVVIGTDWTYYERMWMGESRYSLPSYSRNTARSGDLCLLDSKCLSADAVQAGVLNRT